MLFKFSDTLNVNNYNSMSEEDKKILASNINVLANHGINGEIFLLSHQFFNDLLPYLGIAELEKEFLFKITTKLPMFADMDTKVNMYVEICILNNPDSIEAVKYQGIKIIKIDIRNKIISSISRAPKILCEDVNDFDLYKIILDYFVHTCRSVKFYAMEYIHGGGQRITYLFRNIYSSNKCACLCFYDSDIKCKDGEKGSIAKEIENILNEKSSYFVNAICLCDLREAENILPHNLLCEIFPDKDLQNKARENLIRNCSKESWKYIDMKDGLKRSKIDTYTSEKEKDFWNRLVIKQRLHLENDVYIPGYGNSILQLFSNAITNKPQLIYSGNYRVDSFIEAYWDKIGKYFYTWSCAFDYAW